MNKRLNKDGEAGRLSSSAEMEITLFRTLRITGTNELAG
ncbi:hypothetical protein JOD24_002286 [Kroppenstedtia sanguinis]